MPIDVVAAVIYRQDGAILLSQRAAHQHLGGKWEFPGGKVEAGESLLRALSRELAEELGIHSNLAQPLMTVEHAYSDKSVRLHFFEVRDWQGEASGREGQTLAWVSPAELGNYDFPAADRPLMTALTLGSQLLVWPNETPVFWETRLGFALERGVRLVLARDVTDKALLASIVGICHRQGAKVLVSGDAELMRVVGADGVHLKAAQAVAMTEAPDVPLLSVACHSAAELAQAVKLNADLALLSPVRQTASHVAAVPLGWETFGRLAKGLPLVVFALGGVGPADLVQARAHGAWGVAGISGFWPPQQLLHA